MLLLCFHQHGSAMLSTVKSPIGGVQSFASLDLCVSSGLHEVVQFAKAFLFLKLSPLDPFNHGLALFFGIPDAVRPTAERLGLLV